jgi:hypothetical protein
MKNKFLRALALSGILFTGCSTITPKAGLELAYVPSRLDGKEYSNELMTDMSISAEVPLGKLNFEVGGNSKTFMNPHLPAGMQINWQEYGIYGSMNFLINEYLFCKASVGHLCGHLVNDENIYASEYIDYKDGSFLLYPNKKVLFGSEYITTMGIKLEAKLK